MAFTLGLKLEKLFIGWFYPCQPQINGGLPPVVRLVLEHFVQCFGFGHLKLSKEVNGLGQLLISKVFQSVNDKIVPRIYQFNYMCF